MSDHHSHYPGHKATHGRGDPYPFLYHETTVEAALSIVTDRSFRPSTSGLFGPGIYFARGCADALSKARHHGITLGGKVDLGIPWIIHKDQAMHLSDDEWKALRQHIERNGCSSIIGIGCSTGDEFVIFRNDQIQWNCVKQGCLRVFASRDFIKTTTNVYASADSSSPVRNTNIDVVVVGLCNATNWRPKWPVLVDIRRTSDPDDAIGWVGVNDIQLK
jgi:hypothetical protein